MQRSLTGGGGGGVRYPLRDPFSAVLVNISGGGIQRPLHHAGLWEPTGGVGGKSVVMRPALHKRAPKRTCHTWPIRDGWTRSR